MAEPFTLSRFRKASSDLGCFPVFLIGVVYLASRWGQEQDRAEIRALQAEVSGLKLTAESQAAEIRLLRESMGSHATPPTVRSP